MLVGQHLFAELSSTREVGQAIDLKDQQEKSLKAPLEHLAGEFDTCSCFKILGFLRLKVELRTEIDQLLKLGVRLKGIVDVDHV